MLSQEILQAHYREYASQPNRWVQNMEETKKSIIRYVLEQARLSFDERVSRILVLGASDKRYLPIHERIFQNLIQSSVEITTFDLDTKHLGNENGVVHHDVTEPFPRVPYSLVMSHVLMKFLTPEEQFLMIKNSYGALARGGLMFHIMHSPELEGTSELRGWQYRVDIDSLMNALKQEGILIRTLHFKNNSHVDWLRDTTVLIAQKN